MCCSFRGVDQFRDVLTALPEQQGRLGAEQHRLFVLLDQGGQRMSLCLSQPIAPLFEMHLLETFGRFGGERCSRSLSE